MLPTKNRDHNRYTVSDTGAGTYWYWVLVLVLFHPYGGDYRGSIRDPVRVLYGRGGSYERRRIITTTGQTKQHAVSLRDDARRFPGAVSVLAAPHLPHSRGR